MNQSTTDPASPAKSRQDPPKWCKALVGIGVAVAVLWGFGACVDGMSNGISSAGQRGSDTKPAAAAELPSAAPVDPEVLAFQVTLSKRGVPLAYEPQMVDVARSACDALDAGASPEQLALTAYSKFNDGAGRKAITLEQAGVFVGASVGAFCPRHLDAVNGD